MATMVDDTVSLGYARCEQIAARDKPHLYAASRLFAFAETQRAFASTYASMRLIDDFVDNIPHRRTLTPDLQDVARRHIDDWLGLVRQAHAGEMMPRPTFQALADTFATFALPIAPWEDLATAMRSDLSTPHFTDWDHLRAYMNGASVAPAVVFMYLVLMQPDPSSGRFIAPWPYEEIHAVTADLAIFCYWVHILRDVAIDLGLGADGLVYLPLADLRAHGLTIADLFAMRDRKEASADYIALARSVADRARDHLDRGKRRLPELLGLAPDGNALALKSLVEVYVEVLKKLEACNFDVFRKD